MGARVVSFLDSGTLPDRLFADTSYITTLIEFGDTPESPRCKEAWGFHQRARGSKCRVWTTPFVIEEILWNFVREALRAQMLPYHIESIREFKSKQRAEYERVLESCGPTLATLLRAVKRLKIGCEFPGERANVRGAWGEIVVEKAVSIATQYRLETADAFHLACAYVAGSVHIAALDKDFWQVDGLTVYSHTPTASTERRS